MQLACSGNSFFAIIDHAGQQEVAMNGSFSGTSSTKSSASCAAQVSADGNLNNIRKAEALHRGTQLARCHLRAELADKRRCDSGVRHARPPEWRGSSGKSATCSAIAPNGQFTRHWPQETHFVINIGSAIAIAVDGIHAAGCRARALLTDDGVILTDIHAAAAL